MYEHFEVEKERKKQLTKAEKQVNYSACKYTLVDYQLKILCDVIDNQGRKDKGRGALFVCDCRRT